MPEPSRQHMKCVQTIDQFIYGGQWTSHKPCLAAGDAAMQAGAEAVAQQTKPNKLVSTGSLQQTMCIPCHRRAEEAAWL